MSGEGGVNDSDGGSDKGYTSSPAGTPPWQRESQEFRNRSIITIFHGGIDLR